MAEQSKLERLYAMKAELVELGCKVKIVVEEGEEMITVFIVFPPDVPLEGIKGSMGPGPGPIGAPGAKP